MVKKRDNKAVFWIIGVVLFILLAMNFQSQGRAGFGGFSGCGTQENPKIGDCVDVTKYGEIENPRYCRIAGYVEEISPSDWYFGLDYSTCRFYVSRCTGGRITDPETCRGEWLPLDGANTIDAKIVDNSFCMKETPQQDACEQKGGAWIERGGCNMGVRTDYGCYKWGGHCGEPRPISTFSMGECSNGDVCWRQDILEPTCLLPIE